MERKTARAKAMTGKSRATDREWRDFLRRHPDIRHLDAFIFDIDGTLRGKRIPADAAGKIWQSGIDMPRCMLFLDPTGDDLDPGGRSGAIGDPDGTAWPVAGRLAGIPWAEIPSAQILLQMHDPAGDANAGRPSRFCPRAALAAIERKLHARGLYPVVAVELEFYLLDTERDAEGLPQPPLNPATGKREASKQPYSMEDLDSYGRFIAAVAAHAAAQNIPASTAITEYAPGQFEINLHPQADCLAACDHALLLKRAIQATARAQNYRASFMAKPFLDRAGSGMHIHVSLTDRGGRNLFGETGAEGEKLLRHAIGGLRASLAESMALFGANINAFRRYRPGHNVPVNAAWGENNRSVAFRIPAGQGKARRIEHRVAGADANPYLAVAAILAGMLHGIETKRDPGPAAMGDAGEKPDPALPFAFPAALDRLAAAKILPQYLGADLLALYVDFKRAAQEKFQNRISPQEYDWYL